MWYHVHVLHFRHAPYTCWIKRCSSHALAFTWYDDFRSQAVVASQTFELEEELGVLGVPRYPKPWTLGFKCHYVEVFRNTYEHFWIHIIFRISVESHQLQAEFFFFNLGGASLDALIPDDPGGPDEERRAARRSQDRRPGERGNEGAADFAMESLGGFGWMDVAGYPPV